MAGLTGLCAVLALALFATVLIYNNRLQRALARSEKTAEEERRRIVQLDVTLGMHDAENGEAFPALLWFTDALGLGTRYDYDASSQLTAITAPAVAGASATRRFAYDASGNVVSVTDGENRTVTYQYDARGNQVLQRDAQGDTVTRTFDAGNQLLSETRYTDADPDGAGPAMPGNALVSRQVYDAAGRN